MKKNSILSIGGILSLATLFVLSSTAQAAVPTGVLTYNNLGGEVSENVFSLNGTYTVEDRISTGDGNFIDLDFDVVLVQDAKGKITGTGMTTVVMEDQGDEIATFSASYEIKGKIKSSADVTFVQLKIEVSGSGVLFEETRDMVIKVTHKLVVDTFNGDLLGFSKGTAKATGIESASIESMVMQDLSGSVDGTWDLSLNLALVDGKLIGTGQIELPDGMIIPVVAKGKYSETTDLTKLKLKGINSGVGSKLKLILSDDDLEAYKGKVTGQKVEWFNLILKGRLEL